MEQFFFFFFCVFSHTSVFSFSLSLFLLARFSSHSSVAAIDHAQALAEQYKAECIVSGDGILTGMAAPPPPLFPAGKALSLLDAHASGVADDRDRATFWSTASDLAKVLLQVSRSGRFDAERENRAREGWGGGVRRAMSCHRR